jgi:predicted nucleic acid-binding protein
VKEIHSYVVRIYSRDADAFAGLVEDVRSKRTAPFQSLAELCEVLNRRKPFSRRAARRHGAAGPDLEHS